MAEGVVYELDPMEEMTDGERVAATAALVEAENAAAPSQEDVDRLNAAPDPWDPDIAAQVEDPPPPVEDVPEFQSDADEPEVP